VWVQNILLQTHSPPTPDRRLKAVVSDFGLAIKIPTAALVILRLKCYISRVTLTWLSLKLVKCVYVTVTTVRMVVCMLQ
jgi:hypothetical protein